MLLNGIDDGKRRSGIDRKSRTAFNRCYLVHLSTSHDNVESHPNQDAIWTGQPPAERCANEGLCRAAFGGAADSRNGDRPDALPAELCPVRLFSFGVIEAKFLTPNQDAAEREGVERDSPVPSQNP